MSIKTLPFDPAAYLDDDRAVVAFLSDALETADRDFIAQALDTAARARGMTDLARLTGLPRQSLFNGSDDRTAPSTATVAQIRDRLQQIAENGTNAAE